MPRKRKVNAEAAGGDASSSKKPCHDGSGETTIDSCSVRWEWEGDKNVWTQYASNLNESICKAVANGLNEVDFDVGKTSLAVKIDQMAQKNKKTGWQRRLRCCVQEDGGFYVWQWEDEQGKWNPYSYDIAVKLEKARQLKETEVDVSACARSYRVDLSKMHQTNLVTDVVRNVARIKSDAEESTGETPVVSSSNGDVTATKSGKGKVKVEPVDNSATKSGRGAAKSGGKASKSGRSEEGESKVRTVIVKKGSAPVDLECTLAEKAEVFSEGKDVWDCMLNQTSVGNNNNKYYLIQLLTEGKGKFHVWQRWGRVGYNGQNNLVPCGADLDKAKKIFAKKFTDKTRNNWAERDNFEKVPGKYDLLKMDYGAEGGMDEMDAGPSGSVDSDVKCPPSKLDQRLQNLVNLICDIKSMEEAVIEMKYDAKKAPLGKLTSEQVKAGYAALKVIDTCITSGDFGTKLNRACDDFYTRIPHDFGMRPPAIIRTKEVVELKMQLLEALGDIEIAIKTLKMGDRSENPVDRHYHSLKCKMEPMDHKADDFKMITDYLHNTHAVTHNQFKYQVLDIFEMEKEGETAAFKDYGNRMLLWHGSRLTNWVGILSQGLRIAPPEAPVTGYMFGKGVYFADMSSKSANYCFATKTKNTALLLLCEVSLGQTNDLLNADYNAAKLPPGKHSTRGLGRIGPDPASTKTLTDGTLVPLGKSKDTGVKNPKGYTLNYNEFIVYDTKQIRMKYLVKVKLNFK
ncbi:poly [ADP-ribose] polymerase 2-like isoform X2 [Mizuhopecten yessoensis]|uniref:poly [ADP-ribose] polymerase 2-like isoform X2 n=1 Tax=Mizuhopecten yessoensis TaxID=6573 RepID=UPI000B45DA7E|nr:poly [ADP-ribose] polymerase 2-like isoform X2 [Mizuhopecten yessoensis]